MENKYYQPLIEDLYVGYEMEFYNDNEIFLFEAGAEWIPTKWGYYPLALREAGTTQVLLHKGRIRTPFLSKKQIEGEGWKTTEGVVSSNNKHTHVILATNSLCEISYNVSSHSLWVFKNGLTVYNGSCPSINEFRKIIKWLEI